MKKIIIIGLGYVGLPLAIEFAKKFQVLGFDISKSRVNELKKGIDINGEFTSSEILNKNYVLYDVKSILPKKLITLRL